MILDSGSREEFSCGAVRDLQESKGRCDLMPLDVCADFLHDPVIRKIYDFQQSGKVDDLYDAIGTFGLFCGMDDADLMLEVSVHYAEGCKKYGERNWEKGGADGGIPVWSFISSAVRHYLKWLRHDDDERHDRAFVWNLMGAAWKVKRQQEREGATGA